MFNTQRLKEIKELKDKLEKEEKELKAEIFEEIKKQGKDKYKDELAELVIVKETQNVSIDTKAIEKNDAELYVDLMSKYPKISKRQAYLMVKFL